MGVPNVARYQLRYASLFRNDKIIANTLSKVKLFLAVWKNFSGNILLELQLPKQKQFCTINYETMKQKVYFVLLTKEEKMI